MSLKLRPARQFLLLSPPGTNGNVRMPNPRLLQWFDKIDAILEKEAQLAGLFEHKVSIGTAREFVVTRLLRSFLPSMVEIGTGQVVDAVGSISKLVDIVIYDPRFPALRTGAGALFLIEGVIATIEVKSLLNSDGLDQALENCASVNALTIHGREVAERAAEVARIEQQRGISTEKASEFFDLDNRPATYIFAFNTQMSIEKAAGQIVTWSCRYSTDRLRMLPRAITAGTQVVAFEDGLMRMIHTDGKESFGTAFADERRFRLLACHLFLKVSERLGLRNGLTKADYAIRPYINGGDLVPREKKCYALQWVSS